MSSAITRRQLLKSSTALAGAAAVGRAGASPNEKVHVAVMGSGRGRTLAHHFATLPESELVAVCDVDENEGNQLCARIEKLTGKRPPLVADFRKLLEDKNVDALAVATPDHWHAPATIMACQAGKDVYVEKPCSHNVAEGRLAVTAARKYKRIVQHGTNLRAATHYEEAWALLRKGAIGKVMMVKAINNQYRRRQPIHDDEAVPRGVDYDLWIGPGPKRPFNRNRFHNTWHWTWDFGTGDLGNDGVHQVDLGRWALDLKAPKAVSCSGSKLGSKGDAQQTPDTMVVTWEYDDLLYVFEQRDFTPYRMQGHRQDNDNIFYGDEGYMMVDRDGYSIFYKDGVKGPAYYKKWVDSERHYKNFIDCVKSRKSDDLIADIEEGHYSSLLCHLGNAAYRTGRRLEFDPKKETFVNDAQANHMLTREYRKGFELPRV